MTGGRALRWRHVANRAPVIDGGLRLWVTIWLATWTALPGTSAAAEPVTVTYVDGTTAEAATVAVTPDVRELLLGDRRIPLDDVRWIAPLESPSADTVVQPTAQVWLNGGQIAASDLQLDGDRVQIHRQGNEPWTLPLDRVSAAWWSKNPPPPAFLAARTEPDTRFDRLLLMVNGEPTVIEGYLESLTTEQVRMEWMDEVRTVPRSVCRGFVAARIESAERTAPRFTVWLRDGSTLPAETVRWNDGETPTLTCHIGNEVDWAVNWTDVVQIAVVTPRIVFVSDLRPVEVHTESLVGLPRPWQADRSVSGRPLSTPQLPRARGLGMQSGTRLAYDLTDQPAVQFAAELCLDPETGRTGDCEFLVRGDGRELLRRRVRGGEAPAAIRVDVTGVSQLELGVEYGENFDLADHANWIDARLVRPAP